MSFSNVVASFGVSGGATGTPNVTGSKQTGRVTLGAQDWAAVLSALTFGALDTVANNTGQANLMYAGQLIVNATSNNNVTLSSGLVYQGQAVNFAQVKLILAQILNPDGAKLLRFGPQGVTHAWGGPFSGGVGATVYKEVVDWDFVVNHKWAGYAVGAGATDVLGVYNPGALAVTANLIILGR